MQAHDSQLRERVRSYYGTVSRYIERELLGRRDREFWLDLARDAGRDPPGADGAASRPRDGGGGAAPAGSLPSVLDLGCGTGRVTEILAPHAATVVGVDLSSAMLRRARTRLAPCGNAHLVLSDIRSLQLRRRFDLVVAANDPFIHLVDAGDRGRALESVRRHLEPSGGRFVLDAVWMTPGRMREASKPEGHHRERRVDAGGSDLRIRESWRCDRATRRCSVRFEYFNAGKLVDIASFEARLWDPKEIRPTLAESGLSVRGLWGGFDRRIFDARTATHLIVDAETT